MSQSETQAAPPRTSWIISPTWDIAFLVGTPLAIVPAVTILARRVFTPEQISLVVISFASLGHHLPGFMRAYGDAELFARFKWRFLLTPPLVLATSLLFAWRGLHGLELVLLFWSTWHGLMQTYGFMRIYDLKRGIRDRWTAWLDLGICVSIFAAGLVFSDARVYGIMDAVWQTGLPPLSPRWLAGLRIVVGSSTVVLLAVALGNLVWTGRRAPGVSWTKILLAVTTGWLYWTSGMISTNILVGVAMFEIFHAIQYYAIVWVYNRRLAERAGERFGPLGFLFQDRWTFLGLYLAAIVAFGSIRYFGVAAENPLWQKLLLAVLTTSTLLHFYYDGFMWKVRERDTSANLDIAAPTAPRVFNVPALRHLAKWAVLYTLIVGLVAWEWFGAPKSDDDQQRILANLVAWTPNLPEVQVRVSQAASERGDWKAAIAAAEKALRLRPRSYTAHAQMGKACLDAKRYEEAVRWLRQAVSLAPDQWQNHYNLALVLEQLKRWDDAEQSYLAAIRLQPLSAQLPHHLGATLARSGEPERALVYLRSSLELNPGSRSVRRELAAALSATDQHAEAIAVAGEAVDLDPRSARNQLSLGKALMAAGQFPAAGRAFGEAVRMKPAWVEALYHRGLAHVQLGEAEAAGRVFEQLLERDSQHALAHFQLGNVAYLEGHLERAARRYRRCIELSPEQPDAYNNLGAVLYEQARWDEAAGAYRQALSIRPDNADAHYNLGLLLWEQGHRVEARGHILRAKELGRTPSAEVSALLDL